MEGKKLDDVMIDVVQNGYVVRVSYEIRDDKGHVNDYENNRYIAEDLPSVMDILQDVL